MERFFSLSEIKDLISSHQKNPDKRKAQKRIAESLTLLVHGQEGLELAKKATR
jgi:tyrosyl-tRNA synthetase